MMNGLPMSESIKDILVQDPHVLDAMKYLYITDFDIKPNVILYDTHVVPNKHKQKIQQAMAKKLEPKFQGTERHVGTYLYGDACTQHTEAQHEGDTLLIAGE
ncbi:hypothetical protein JHK82_049927 [Glycine max]|nr:hypothetical protein JHK82_049927 [Glycine max]